MNRVLLINSSASHDRSVSRKLVGYAEKHLVATWPGIKRTHRDVGA
jgi:FMN-dependent NADH-azoreductase